jgi:hypothetical protein
MGNNPKPHKVIIMQSILEDIKKRGYLVYAPENITSYFYVTDAHNIAYVQYSNMRGLEYSSLHKPCLHAGVGYTCRSLNEALGYKPEWAHSSPINKYKDFPEFQAKHWQKLVQY